VADKKLPPDLGPDRSHQPPIRRWFKANSIACYCAGYTTKDSASPARGARHSEGAPQLKHLWHDLSPGPNPPEDVRAIIEIPGGSRNKYELDKESGLLRLDRVLYSAVHYPADYGFIPGTLAEDDDPLDVLVLLKEPTFPGCEVDIRPLGILHMLDRGVPDEKILGVPTQDPLQQEFLELDDVPKHLLMEIQHFFQTYKDLEGKRVEIQGWENRTAAYHTILAAITRYGAAYP
jgi:inorganic pyrophosphatase